MPTCLNSQSSRAAAILLSLALLLSYRMSAQGPPPPQPPQSGTPTTLPITVNLVVLPVTVKDQSGVLVPDLEQNEFRIFDDGVEQSLSFFNTDARPLSLVVLVDDDLKSADAQNLVTSLHALLWGISVADEAMICHFDLKFYPGEAFTSDQDRLMAQLTAAQGASGPSTSGPVPYIHSPGTHPPGVGEPRYPAAPIHMGSAPTKALDDAIFSAAELLKDRGRDRRKLILVISDGINGAVFNTHNYEDTLASVQRSDASVFSLAIGSDSYHKKFARLRSYSNDSGGDIYYASKSVNMEKLYSYIAEQARHEYTLAYSPRGNDSTSNYHKVEVRTTRPNLQIQTRHGYYSHPPESQPPK
jgi:Ca-activated chloride channel family protein